jgi:Flp pilus assembly protein TadD
VRTNQRQALEISPKDVKALFRKAQAEAGLKEFDNARASLAEAIKLEPSNKSLRTELDKYTPPLSFLTKHLS